MPFDITYGPISDAMQLAQRAGQGQYNQQQFQNSNAFLGTLNDMQRTADARRATDMQNALGYTEANSHLALAQAQMAQMAAYHQAQLGSLNNYRNNMVDYHNANVAVRERAVGDQEDNTQDINANGGHGGKYAPPALADPTQQPAVKALQAQVNNLAKNDQVLAEQGKSLSTEEVNPLTKAKTGRIVPRPGQEAAYNQWLAQRKANSDALQSSQAQLQSMLQGQQPAKVSPAAISPQQQAQTAQAASGGATTPGQPDPNATVPQNGVLATATGPNGEKIYYDQTSGRWVAAPPQTPPQPTGTSQ